MELILPMKWSSWIEGQESNHMDVLILSIYNNSSVIIKDITIPEIREAMTVLEEFANDSEKFEYYQSRHRIQMMELSVEAENRKIREDYASAVKQLDTAVEERNKLVKSLLASKTMTVEQIAETTGISIDEIKKLSA